MFKYVKRILVEIFKRCKVMKNSLEGISKNLLQVFVSPYVSTVKFVENEVFRSSRQCFINQSLPTM
jgi:hypothetical protein